ncbi:MAG: M48 family metallopeptidase [Egibacteraceae bacterium]
MLYDQLSRNRWMTVVLFVGFTVLVVGLALALEVLFLGGGGGAAYIAIAVIVGVLIFSWFAADRAVLSALRARAPNPAVPEERTLPDIIEGLALAAGLPMPAVYVIDDPAPNAFATGRSPDKGVVAFTTGLLQKMNRQQVEAVAAHELSHIGNRDSLIGVVAAVLVGVILVVCRVALRLLFFGGGRRRGGGRGGGGGPIMLLGLAVLILAPIFALLLRFAISRRRESHADVNAVRLTRNPEAMISALEVLDADHTSVDFAHGFAAHLWIEEPSDKEPGWITKMFSTHPPVPDRIEALRAIAGDSRYR